MLFIKLFFCAIVVALCAASATVGVVLMFSAFFFEQTLAQMTWGVAAQHLLMFAVGGALVAAPAWAFTKVVEVSIA
jgi:energy-converting hydrogenase Eha subunit E